jgi:hypothetical protein
MRNLLHFSHIHKRENIFGKFQFYISVTSIYVLNKYRSSENNSDTQTVLHAKEQHVYTLHVD